MELLAKTEKLLFIKIKTIKNKTKQKQTPYLNINII